MEFNELKPDGIYCLTEDLKNPHPDRRFKRQPDKEVMWPKGTRFVARERVYEDNYDDVDVRVVWFDLEWIDRDFGSLYAVPVREKVGEHDPRADQAKVIMAALAIADEDFKAFTTRLGMKAYSMRAVMERFCDSGVLTHQQIEDEYNAWLEE